MMAGVTVVAWYPITPSSSLPETLIGYLKKLRKIPTPERRPTLSSRPKTRLPRSAWCSVPVGPCARDDVDVSPGISLMGEFAGLAYAEVPGVVWDIQRRAFDHTHAHRHDLLSTAALARRHEANHADAGDRRGMLLDGDGRVRPCRALPVDCLRDERSGPGDEYGCRRRFLGLTGRSIAASGSTPRCSSGSASGAGHKDVDRWHPYRTVPGESMPAFFTRRFGPQRESAVKRTPRRLRGEHGASGAQVRDGAQASRSRSSRMPPARRSG